MKKIINLFVFLVLYFFSNQLIAQCECPPLPPLTGIVDTVSNSTELQSALHAANQNNGNYTILLEDGLYELNNNLLYIGQNMVNLTIRSLSGDRDAVVIKGQGMDGNIGYVFNVAASGFIAADMTIGWVGNHAIQIHAEHDADYPLIQNVKFVDIKEQMLKVSGSTNSTFSDGGVVQCCEFEFTDGVGYWYYTGGIDAHRAKDWEIRNNIFRHIRSPESMLAEHAIHLWSWSENTLVENNLIIDCDRGIGFGLGSSGHNGGIIRNNFVHTSRDVGIGLESAPDVKIYHNTVVTENYFNSIEYRFVETENVHIANNLTNEKIASRDGGTGNIESNFQFIDNSIFVDANNFDYHLFGENSSITDAGIELAEAGQDYDCHQRTDGLPDIGADEYNSIINSQDEVLKNEEVLIFPNPNNGSFQVELNEGNKLEIYDLFGNKIAEKESVLNREIVLFNNFTAGIYLLVINGKERKLSRVVVY